MKKVVVAGPQLSEVPADPRAQHRRTWAAQSQLPLATVALNIRHRHLYRSNASLKSKSRPHNF
ncbi:hypothetical protein OUZ56_019894 [Daphnia magna]|uniref:Uncharacterized protein n=1 Tax=Daphnia magna TaxID=35525 RepID=A0ABQ9ZCX9_9CRUS|nr:hypothetical protein OUZ56_019894 [Daphnia magna]